MTQPIGAAKIIHNTFIASTLDKLELAVSGFSPHKKRQFAMGSKGSLFSLIPEAKKKEENP